MAKSIEHSEHFQMARRIGKIIAPDFRIMSTEALESGASCIDLTAKTIEVSENTRIFEAVGAILFSLGQLKYRNDPRFGESFGRVKDLNEERLIETLSKQSAQLDTLAQEWSINVFSENWTLSSDRISSIISAQIKTYSEWKEYFS